MTLGSILKRINAGGVKYATTKRERAMSKMKEWLLDRQENEMTVQDTTIT